jgi:putative endonuclease
MYYVYIVECADKTLYTGYTNNLEKRIKTHNEAKTGAKYTKARRPVVLKYSEKLPDLSQALKREIEIKNLTRKEKLKLIELNQNSKHKITNPK